MPPTFRAIRALHISGTNLYRAFRMNEAQAKLQEINLRQFITVYHNVMMSKQLLNAQSNPPASSRRSSGEFVLNRRNQKLESEVHWSRSIEPMDTSRASHIGEITLFQIPAPTKIFVVSVWTGSLKFLCPARTLSVLIAFRSGN